MSCQVCAVMPVFQESPWTAWKFIRAPWSTTLLESIDHCDRSGPTILGKRQAKDPFCSDVGLGFFFGLGLGLGFVVVVTGTVVVEVVVEVEPGVVVEVDARVVVVVGMVGFVVVVTGTFVVDDAGTNFTGR